MGKNYFAYALLTAYTSMCVLGMYAKMWESRQPTIEFRKALVESAKPVSYATDLFGTSHYIAVRINGLDHDILFKPNKEVIALKKGDGLESITCREGFSLSGRQFRGMDLKK